MKAREDHPSAVDTQFDEWAKAVAHGLTRRKTLQLIGGTFTGAFLALRGSKAWATPSPGTQGCGHICAPLFNPSNQAAFNACTQACEDCQSCHGNPSLTTTAPQVLVCSGATPCRSGSGVICCTVDAQTPANSQTCCHGACYNPCTGGQVLSATTCTCACPSGSQCCSGQEVCLDHLDVCCGGTCVPSGQCCGGVVCLSGQTCIGGICTST